MKELILIAFFTGIMLSSPGQQKKLIKKAEKMTGRVEYAKALVYYNQALETDQSSYRANAGKGLLLGNFMDRYEEAIPFLESALSNSPADTLNELFHVLGRAYHFMGEYEKAIYYYMKLRGYAEVGNDRFQDALLKRITDCRYALQHPPDPDSEKIIVKNIGAPVNTPEPEYAPVVTPHGSLIFTSKRKDDDREKINQVDGKYFESMYISNGKNEQFSSVRRYTRPDKLQHSRFSKYNESSISISPDGQSLFIYKGGDLFETRLNDTLQSPGKLSDKINFARYQSHASLSADGNTIYFTSESEKGQGGTDLYRAVKGSTGEWGEAELLDSTVNTVFDEDSPFLAEDGTLYFASTGHPGYGGYDLYKTKEVNGKWQTPENLGAPINSPGTDIFLSYTDKDKGYFSSARPGGFGDMDIYSISDRKGLEPDTPADPLLASQMAEDKQDAIAEEADAEASPFMSETDLHRLNWNPSSLHFNYSQYTLREDARRILDHNIRILKQHKDLAIIINGHSDSKGPVRFNQALSAKRAEQVKQYLIQKGISSKRIQRTEGLGESRLTNGCSDQVECDETAHQENRRAEIQVLNPTDAIQEKSHIH